MSDGLWIPESEVGTGANPGVVSTQCAILTATFTRPADTTAYAVNDAVSNSTSAPVILTFANAARVEGGSGEILKAELCTDLATCTAAIRAYVFSTAVAVNNDNAAYTMLYTNRNSRVGWIDFPGLSSEGAGSTSAVSLVTGSLPYVCDAASTALYLALVTKSAWTPASAQNFNIRLLVRKN